MSQTRRSGELATYGPPAESRGRFGMRPKAWRKVRRWGFITGAGLFAVMIIGSFALSAFPGGGRSASVSGSTARAEYVGALIDDTDSSIHQRVGQRIRYDLAPPNQGDHWVIWAQCGIYTEEINDEHLVHNLEHGHVVISYNLSDPQEVQRIEELAADLSGLDKWGVVRPYSRIDEGTVAMAAWGVSDQVQGVDEERIKAFYKDNIRNRNSTEAATAGPISCA